jgi:hypothetical protein
VLNQFAERQGGSLLRPAISDAANESAFPKVDNFRRGRYHFTAFLMNPCARLVEADVLRIVEKARSSECLTDLEVEMLAMTASTPDLDEKLFDAFLEFVCGGRISGSQVLLLADRLCEKAQNVTTANDSDKIFYLPAEKDTELAVRLAAAHEMSLQNEVLNATNRDPATEALLRQIFGEPAE